MKVGGATCFRKFFLPYRHSGENPLLRGENKALQKKCAARGNFSRKFNATEPSSQLPLG
jgi:hypothetical protein